MSARYLGMNASSGRSITDLDHLRQSVADILTTPIGSMITLRDYGSHAITLIDQPITPALRLQAMAAAVMALLRWEPRLQPADVALTLGEHGSAATLELTLVRTEGPLAGQPIQMSVPLGRRPA